MAFADPQKVKVDGTTEETLPRIDTGSFSSDYANADGTIALRLSTQNGKRVRHVARIDLSKFTDDPIFDGQNVKVGTSAYLVVDRPESGYTQAELKKLVEGLVGFLSASSYASVTKLLGKES